MCDCPILACKRYRIWGCMFLKPEDLENVKVSSLSSLVASTGLGLVFQPHTSEELQWNSNDLGVVRACQGTPRFYLLLLLTQCSII
jgi:hypothetical protein